MMHLSLCQRMRVGFVASAIAVAVYVLSLVFGISEGQLFFSNPAPAHAQTVTLLEDVVAIAGGTEHTCALTSYGGVKCWGYNAQGALGNGTNSTIWTPVNVVGLGSGATAVGLGHGHSCAINETGGVVCWGLNGAGQLGNGATGSSNLPVAVIGLASGVKAVAGGTSHTCAVTTAGAVFCWGRNNFGQLGDGTQVDKASPVSVVGLSSGVQAIAAGNDHTCVITATGGIQCWGSGFGGKLGVPPVLASTVPVNVTGITNGATAIAAGVDHSCAIVSGAALCWGENNQGQIGDNSMTNRSAPVQVSGLASGVARIAAGGDSTCAVTTSGAAKCWGRNNQGQVGDGTEVERRLVPTDVIGLSNGVATIGVGDNHACAVTLLGGALCWGDGASGRLGNDSNEDTNTPVLVHAGEPTIWGLSVSKPGSGTGTVVSTPAGINCGATCAAEYLHKTAVQLVATPTGDSTFAGWSGACAGTSTTCNVTMSQARAVTAIFTAGAVTLDLIIAGTGTGSVNYVDGGSAVICTSSCSPTFDHDTEVPLIAAPDFGSTFGGWSGDCSGMANLCFVTMSQARSATATFVIAIHALNLSFAGNSGGSVAFSEGSPESCSANCGHSYTHGTSVTLIATPNANTIFGGWSGACSGTNPQCTVNMTAVRNVVATFVLETHTLDLTFGGTGSGAVTFSAGSPPNCANDCSHGYDYGTSVTLTAAPATGSTFTGWSGACVGADAECTVSMTQARAAVATFTLNTHTLDLAFAGSGMGSVGFSAGAQSSCASDCSQTYDYGASVTLTAVPGANSAFSAWSGDCTGTASVCTIDITASRVVTASFVFVNTPVNANDIALSANIAYRVSSPELVGNFSLSGASVQPEDTYSWSLVDAASYPANLYFTLDAATGALHLIDVQIPSGTHSIQVQVDDGNGSQASRVFEIHVPDAASLSFPDEMSTIVRQGSQIAIPIAFADGGRSADLLGFTVQYDTGSLTYLPQSGDGVASASTGKVRVERNDPLAGVVATPRFTPLVDDALVKRTPLTILTPQSPNPDAIGFESGGAPLPIAPFDGSVIVVRDNVRGDCNDSGAIGFDDLFFTARELFDDNALNAPLFHPAGGKRHWLNLPGGAVAGSPLGCDSNANGRVDIGDVVCAANLLGERVCTQGNVAPADGEGVILRHSEIGMLRAGDRLMLVLALEAGGNSVGGIASSIQLDAALAVDAATPFLFLLAEEFDLRYSVYDAASHTIHFAVASSAGEALAEGIFAAIPLTAAQPVTTPQLSFVDLAAAQVEGTVVDALSQPGDLSLLVGFLPSIAQ